MKKTIAKPENWQDFETLCKKLWGEIWSIPNSIKKNGRLGQEQSGVDIYGKPSGSENYWGIQCKGKDDYSNAKLTKKEIDEEIEKARQFKPKLDGYIFATSANKDASIEEYVRIRDIQNRQDSFEISLFCWEDIVDLIEENKDTFNWYVNEINQRQKYDFNVFFTNFHERLTLNPKFNKEITKFVFTTKSDFELMQRRIEIPAFNVENISLVFPFEQPEKINQSWCDFDIILKNIGSMVIEDWKFKLKFTMGVRRIRDEYESILITARDINFRTTYVDDENKIIQYFPLNKSPLIQKDNRYFKVCILPEHYVDKIIAEWELLARDFSREGTFEIDIEPHYIEKVKIREVNKANQILEDKIYISDYIEAKNKNNA